MKSTPASTSARFGASAATLLTVLSLVSGVCLLSGCGQTGKLYMPKPPAKPTPVPVPPHLPSASSPSAQ